MDNVDKDNPTRFSKRPAIRRIWGLLQNSHTLFMALFPPISLYAINISRYPGAGIFRSMFALLLIGAGLVLLLRFVLHDWEKATVLSSLILFFSTNYGHVYTGLNILVSRISQAINVEFSLRDVSVGAHILLSFLWIMGLRTVYRLATRNENWKRRTPPFLTLAALIALLIPTVRIILSWGSINSSLSNITIHRYSSVNPSPNPELGLPDVYYIFLDAYGREDILEEFYQYDNSYFLDELEEKGFHVAEKSRSNYSNTITSLASSLNMNYLDEIAEIPSDDVLCRMMLARSIDTNEVMRLFKELGYKFIAFSTGFPTTEITQADLYLQSPEIGLNPFESLLVKNSILLPVFSISAEIGLPIEYPGFSGHRQRISYIFETLPQFSDDPEPTFVFAHVVAPHPPFVFTAEGEEAHQRYPYVVWDGDMFQGTDEEYIQGYSGQVTFLNNSLLAWLDGLLESSPDSIVILQGDHGPRSTVVWRSPSQDGMREGTSILNAYHLPGIGSDALYDEITPVNTFRLILNEYFDAGLELLPDRTFFMSTGCQDFSFELK